MSARWVVGWIVVVLVVVGGAVWIVRPSTLPYGAAHVDGPLLVSAKPGMSRGGMDAIVTGEVTYDDGCLRLDSHPVVWPHGTSWDGESSEVVLPNGERAGVGAQVTGGGGHVDAQTFTEGERPYGDYGDEGERILADCADPSGQVAFFNEGSEVSLVE